MGGLIGAIELQSPSFSLKNSYAVGVVTAGQGKQVGGLIGLYSGQANNENISSSYWDIQTSGQPSPSCGSGTGSLQCGTGKNTGQMYQQETFVNWDFNTIWDISENKNYPCLRGLSCIVLKN